MILCSVFWFHPLIWIVNRKMLSDREQACDQEVCLLGGQSAVYAASLLKVLRFCIGFRMVGLSSAAGPNLKRRIEEIMANELDQRHAPRQRAFVVTVALAVIVFSVAAGVMSRDRLFSQQVGINQEGVKGGVHGGGARVGNSGIAGTGTQFEFRMQSENVSEDLKNAVAIPLPFDNNDQSPVIITEAGMKAVKARSVYKKVGNDLEYWADQYFVHASVTLLNNSSQRVKRVWLVFSCDKAGPVGYPTAPLLMEPGATIQITQREWSGLGDPSSFSVKVGEVLFAGGSRWPGFLPDGTLITPPPPPPPPPPIVRR
jgi:hypothetical protein